MTNVHMKFRFEIPSH